LEQREIIPSVFDFFSRSDFYSKETKSLKNIFSQLDLMHLIPLTDRYYDNVKDLGPFSGELALSKYRIITEVKYLLALSDLGVIRLFSAQEKELLLSLSNLTEEDHRIIKLIERTGYNGKPPVYHDVRAVENYVREKLSSTSLKDITPWIHFGLTSDDTNNISYALLHTELLNSVIKPNLEAVLSELLMLSQKFKGQVMIARTHGQPATPTTFGKEFFVFYERIRKEKEHLFSLNYEAKLNGATGTFSAHVAAFPQYDWKNFSLNFIESLNDPQHFLKIKANLITTQIEPHDSFARICDSMRRINVILIGFCQDVWGYTSDGWLTQKTGKTEGFSYVGSSSTMPHKLNPTDFENAEGNLGLANALFEFFSGKLLISRFQRDLSDSSVMRNSILPFAYSLNAYRALLKGFTKMDVHAEKIKEFVNENPEVIAEGIQTILRANGDDSAYDKMKEFLRGKRVSLDEIRTFLMTLPVSDEVKLRLLSLSPWNYYGLASELVSE